MTQKNRHLRTIAGYIFATKACIGNRKKLVKDSISSTCLHNVSNIGPLTAEILSGVLGTPADFNGVRVFASLVLRRRSPEANQTLHDVSPSPGLVRHIYIFGGSCSPTRNFATCKKSLCVQVLRSSILAALLHGTPAAGSDKLCGVEQRAPPIFGSAAITLGLGPHSSIVK